MHFYRKEMILHSILIIRVVLQIYANKYFQAIIAGLIFLKFKVIVYKSCGERWKFGQAQELTRRIQKAYEN